jgi:hypothetical protein
VDALGMTPSRRALVPVHRDAQSGGLLVGLGVRHHGVEHRHPALQADEVLADAAGDETGVGRAVLPVDHRLHRPERGAEGAARLQPIEQLHRAVLELARRENLGRDRRDEDVGSHDGRVLQGPMAPCVSIRTQS